MSEGDYPPLLSAKVKNERHNTSTSLYVHMVRKLRRDNLTLHVFHSKASSHLGLRRQMPWRTEENHETHDSIQSMFQPQLDSKTPPEHKSEGYRLSQLTRSMKPEFVIWRVSIQLAISMVMDGWGYKGTTKGIFKSFTVKIQNTTFCRNTANSSGNKFLIHTAFNQHKSISGVSKL